MLDCFNWLMVFSYSYDFCCVKVSDRGFFEYKYTKRFPSKTCFTFCVLNLLTPNRGHVIQAEFIVWCLLMGGGFILLTLLSLSFLRLGTLGRFKWSTSFKIFNNCVKKLELVPKLGHCKNFRKMSPKNILWPRFLMKSAFLCRKWKICGKISKFFNHK